MTVEYRSAKIHGLSTREYNAVVNCNMRDRGTMQDQIRRMRSRPSQWIGRVVMAWDGDYLAGCCLVFRRRHTTWTIHTYVRQRYRRQGIGGKLCGRARMGIPSVIYVYAWQVSATGLYKKLIDAGRCKDRE